MDVARFSYSVKLVDRERDDLSTILLEPPAVELMRIADTTAETGSTDS